MTLNSFEEAWRREIPAPGAEELSLVLRRIERDGRWHGALQFTCGVVTTISTFALVVTFSRRGFVWPMLLQLIAAGALVVLMRRQIARRRRLRSLGASVSETVSTALRDTRERMAELKALAGYGIAAAAVLAVAVYQLHRSGKMDARSVAGFSMLTGVVLLANAIGWGWHYRRSLRPRQKRLEALWSALGGS